jgi:hypothetical protein
VLKAYSDARNRCYVHPHRIADRKCERCKTGLCSECAREYRGKQLCERCLEELDFIEASKPTLASRVRDFFTSVRNTVIVVVVLVVFGGGIFYLFRGYLNQPITPEEMARFRYAAAGSFQTPEGINVNSTVLGAKIVSFTSQRTGFEATHLINEYTGVDYPGWRSASVAFPQDVVVEHEQVAAVSKVILTQQGNEPPATWAKDVEIDASTEGPDRGYTRVGQWRLEQVTESQKFTFPVVSAKWLLLRVLSNYGSTDYTSLSEFDAYVVTQNPLAGPTQTSP